ncbi:hypothetical protein C8R44DRAFT_888272 [Mycena epipterygia]|nr:hypothetical protein C8R44DRAFT_888272 [Mycena epipterygia]
MRLLTDGRHLIVVMLINCRDSTYVLVSYSPSQQDPILVRGFLILCAQTFVHEVRIYPLAAFEGLWRPVSTLDPTFPIDRLGTLDPTPAVPQTIEFDTKPFSPTASIRMEVHASLLDADAYIVSIYASESPPPGFVERLLYQRAAFIRYRLKPGGRGSPAEWNLLSTRAAPNLTLSSLSYTGYATGGMRGGILELVPQEVLRMGSASKEPVVPSRTVIGLGCGEVVISEYV